jgi:hypothetical protein
MPFATTKCFKHELPPVIEPCRRVELGYRQKGHNFDHHEYAAYEHAKNDILSSGVGRVARLRGGILWWLAQDLVKVKAITQGPNKIQMRVLRELDDHYLIDDVMSQEEEDIICGIYHVKHGMLSYPEAPQYGL